MAVRLELKDAPQDSPDFDPMTAWIAGIGRDFTTILKDRPDSKTSFRHVAVIDDQRPIESIRDGRSRVWELPEAASGEGLDLKKMADFVASQHVDWDPRFFLLPVTPEAIRPDLTLFKSRDNQAIKRGGPPVVGIIDYAINMAHHRFRASDKTTRIARLWDQAGRPEPAGVMPFGRVWTASEIDQAIEDAGDDEEQILRALEQIDFGGGGHNPLARAASHGTHVLDLATGASGEDRASAPAIFAVNLPPIVARETTGAFLGICFLLGVDFILSQVRESAGSAPTLLNFSLALSGGPRSGRHILERALDGLIDTHRDLGGGPVTVLMAAGNRNLSQGHAVRTIPPQGGEAQFHWRLQPGDPSANMLDIWIALPQGESLGFLGLELAAPDGRRISEDFSKTAVGWIHAGDDVVGRVSLSQPGEFQDDKGGQKGLRLSIILAPTDPGQSGRAPAPPGRWTVTVGMDPGAELAAWVMRDDVVPGFGDTGRQSYLDDPTMPQRDERGALVQTDPVPPRSGLRRAGMMNALATGRRDHVICVGAAVGDSTTTRPGPFPAPYSSAPLPAGSTFGPNEKIACSAVADRSILRPGVAAAGAASGTRHMMNGTSVAAPRVLRALLEDHAFKSTDPAQADRRLGDEVLPLPDDG